MQSNHHAILSSKHETPSRQQYMIGKNTPELQTVLTSLKHETENLSTKATRLTGQAIVGTAQVAGVLVFKTIELVAWCIGTALSSPLFLAMLIVSN